MLIYLHGLNSSSRSAKADMLRDRIGSHRVKAPDYPAHRPEQAVAYLEAFFQALDTPSPTVIGSSMGGFYGQWLARRFRFSRLFMINPALTPWTLFRDRIGESMTTAQGETYTVTTELIERTRPFGIHNPCDGIPTTLFLDRGDEIIDYRIAEQLYQPCGQLLIWDGGDHGFQHMDQAITVLRDHLGLSN